MAAWLDGAAWEVLEEFVRKDEILSLLQCESWWFPDAPVVRAAFEAAEALEPQSAGAYLAILTGESAAPLDEAGDAFLVAEYKICLIFVVCFAAVIFFLIGLGLAFPTGLSLLGKGDSPGSLLAPCGG